MDNVANFCPVCGTATEQHERYGRLRPICPQCGHIVFFAPSVAVLVLMTNNDQILLVKRKLDPARGLWVCPAGFMDADENPRDAARREVREETGLDVDDLQLLEVFGRMDDGGKADLVLAFRATIMGGTLKPGDDAEEAAWFTKDALPELAFAPTKIVVRYWATGQW
ncbi:MAG: NUDIX domain-containing protein [Anaerolineae bacterium]